MRLLILSAFGLILSCDAPNGQQLSEPLFTLMPSEETGITFSNDVAYTPEFNMYTYRNFYNGGGVGMGDINNDGLADIFFCGNLKDNQLYLNKGDFKFEDITDKAGVASENVWSTGVSFVDINADGWLDIYVCKSGKPGGDKRYNELFINNGDLTFSEKAKEYGIADEGLASHAAFFDYDKDGDLDFYLLNNSFRPVGGFDMRAGLRDIRDSLGGNKLYRNDIVFANDGTLQQGFTDVSEEAGIYGSAIGFGLGVTIGDINKDGWQDIFVSNDFFERDYLYINQKDGTFKEDLVNQIPEISMGSMGADMADINNDGYPEIFVTEMLPETDARYKSKMTFENWDKYQLSVRSGYHHQFTRNVLQLNNGNNTFSEIARLANVHATDWSWSALMADFDNDGHKDIYVSNGIYKDLLDQDYINFHSNDPEIIDAIKRKEKDAILKLIDIIPSERIPNYAFRNNRDLTFSQTTKEWGLEIPSHSNGAIYGDLDNDGDLDLLVNNCNMPAFVFRNEANTLIPNHYLSVRLKGKGKNTFALGAQISAHHQGEVFYQELAPMRGFQSNVDQGIHLGLGDIDTLEVLKIKWPSGKVAVFNNIPTNQQLNISEEEYGGTEAERVIDEGEILLKEEMAIEGLAFNHQENEFIDFDRDKLLYHMVSTEGPKMCKGDVNGDGLEDIWIGGASKQTGALLIQQEGGAFSQMSSEVLQENIYAEDTDATFFDADNDGDLDLYVCSGGNEFTGQSRALADRLYLNDGSGNFQKSPQKLPSENMESTSCVIASDIDGDGDQDLFVGTRLEPGVYGVPVNGYILQNDGKGTFKDVTDEIAPDLKKMGLITDALWTDYDQDGDEDLFVVGEWMPLSVFENDEGKLLAQTNKAGFAQSNGFWNCIKAGDFDNDGDTDYVIGNHGLNTRFKASTQEPISMLVNDFDGNRTAEQIVSVYNQGTSYPLALRHDLTMQMPSLKKKYLYYENYKEQTVQDIFSEKQIRTSAKSFIYNTQTSIAWNQGKGKFSLQALPVYAQLAPIYGLMVIDLNEDGNLDILTGGNFHQSKPEVGIYDASYGLVLLGDGGGNFEPLSAQSSGFKVKGEIRDFLSIDVEGKEIILVGRNDESILTYARNN